MISSSKFPVIWLKVVVWASHHISSANALGILRLLLCYLFKNMCYHFVHEMCLFMLNETTWMCAIFSRLSLSFIVLPLVYCFKEWKMVCLWKTVASMTSYGKKKRTHKTPNIVNRRYRFNFFDWARLHRTNTFSILIRF